MADLTSIAGGLLGIIPSAVKWFTGASQRRKAAKIKPIDPGFQANTGILENKRTVDELYNNYTLPGMSTIKSELGANYASGVNNAIQGSTSSGDVLDAVTKLNFGQNQAINALGVEEAQMKQALLPQVLDANAAAGNELVRRNQFDEARYQAALAEKAALNQAAAANQFGATDQLATLGGSLLNYKAEPWSRNSYSTNFRQLPPLNFRGING